MNSVIAQWFPGEVKPIRFKPHLFDLDLDAVEVKPKYRIDFGDGTIEETSSQAYKIVFGEPNGTPSEGYLSDKTQLVKTLTDIENAMQTNNLRRYALSAVELFPNSEKEITFFELENRVRVLYALYLSYRLLIWHDDDVKIGNEVKREDLGAAYPPFYWQETFSKYLQKMPSKKGQTVSDVGNMPLRDRAKLIVQDIVQAYLAKNVTIDFCFEKVPIYKKVGGRSKPIIQYEEKFVDRYVCDSLFSALLLQIVQYIQLGDQVKRSRTLKACEQCGQPFLAQRSDTRFCPQCGSGANRQARYVKTKKEAK